MNTDNKFFNKLYEVLGGLSEKLSENIYIQAIKDGMLAYMPFTFIASIFLIIAFLPIEPYQNFMISVFGESFVPNLCLVNDASLGIGGVLVLLTISRNLAEKMEINALQVQITALIGYMLLVPFGADEAAGNFIAVAFLGAQSIFLSILVSIVACNVYRFIDRKGLKIKMPASVPPAVSAPFESIIPSLITITLFWVIRLAIDNFNGTSALEIFNSILGAPLQAAGGSLIGIILVKMFSQLLWFFGIHGDSITNAVMTPIFQVLQMDNQAASLAGTAPANIICQSFWDSFASIGIIGSIIAICLIARSRRYKEMKKIAMVPYIFNVGEPTLFGIPLMMNVIYFIPFILANVVSILIAYFATAVGFMPVCTGLAQVPWTTPLLISGYLSTGSIMGSVTQLICLVAVVLIWLPFVKIADKQICEEETVEETAVQK
ncbi:PTS sugar transporter subunit IIC [uncultured Dubosiella sp.]|uniref:PTS sugar transporter subunit IIC n=1 Tax=uncultured Dubosiella sp. TaxID=1937011 RepID=UPI0025B531C6|nr:PTS transporter subunit EIIC [uncultured Dubosiella sp.]